MCFNMFKQLCLSLLFFCTKSNSTGTKGCVKSEHPVPQLALSLVRHAFCIRSFCSPAIKCSSVNFSALIPGTSFFRLRDAQIFCSIFSLCTFLCVNIVQAQSVTPPTNVSALIYSSNAAELFWKPSFSNDSGVANRMQIKRNGQLLGQFDARSLFQPGLSPTEQSDYELRSVDSNGQLSEPVLLSLLTNNFSLPIKRVYPAGQSGDDAAVVSIQEVGGSGADGSNSLDSNTATDATSNTSADAFSNTEAEQVAQGAHNCIVRDLNSLRSCISNANAYRQIDIASNISCDNNCCPNGVALLQLNNISNLIIDGHDNRILRRDSQRQCSLLDMNNSSNVSLINLHLDDDQQVAGCQVRDNCARMVHIKRSSNVSFNNTHVAHGKGYAFYVQATNGFKFEHSSLHNSGVLGMYIGHSSDASSNIRISDSIFSDNQTNGLALLGLTGQSLDSNIVANNLFIRNHRRGQWAVAPQFGSGFTGGGQFYIAQASNVTVRDNVLKDGFCDNCFVQNYYRSGISGIELGLPNNRSVANVLISNNRVLNHDGFGILQNSSSGLNNVQVRGNTLLNNTTADNLTGASVSGNRAIDTQQFNSFENASELGGRYKSSITCSSDSLVERRCGSDSRYGQCAVQMSLGTAACEGASVMLSSNALSTSSGKSVVANGWVKNPVGQWCLVFRDGSGNQLLEQCKNISDVQRSDVQPFVGLPELETTSPAGSHSVELRVRHWNQGTSMSLDDLSLSVAR